MARSPYTIIERTLSNGTSVFMARYVDETGRALRTITFPKARSRTAASRLAEQELRKGVIPRADDPDALAYLYEFWKRDSDYVRGRAARGVKLSDRYLQENILAIKKHLAPSLKGLRLLAIDTKKAEAIVLSLVHAGVGPRRINVSLQALRVPLTYFCRQHHIADPLLGFEKLAENTKERGTLSPAEVARIVALEGESPRAKAAVLLGALCGLRLGECRGLQWSDVDEQAGIIHVVGNFVDAKEGRKAPKCGSSRDIPLCAPVQEALDLCKKVAPPDAAYVLWNDRQIKRPVTAACLQSGFRRILLRIGIDGAGRQERNLCFHSLRHTFVSLFRAEGIPDFIIQTIAGHRSSRMMDRYSHGDKFIDFTQAREAIERALESGTADASR